MVKPELLLLADGRFPAGGHAHSFGAEAAVRSLGLTTVEDLRQFLAARLDTVGRTEAALAAHVVAHPPADWSRIDAEAEARLASPAVRASSRQLGRQLLRSVGRVWPGLALAACATVHPDGPHQSVAWGAVVGALGGSPEDAAMLTLHHLATGIATATVRLLGLDPFLVHFVLAELGDQSMTIAAEVANVPFDPAKLPAVSVALADVLAEAHFRWDDRLFTS